MILGSAVFPDANFWISRTLRDWLIQIYLVPEMPPFTVYWTEDVYAETIYHLRRRYPFWDDQHITKLREKLMDIFNDGHLTGFAGRPDDRVLDDPNDQHIHAAAVACHADYLVTFDKGFRNHSGELPYEVYAPDEFFVLLDDSMPGVVAQAALRQWKHWIGRENDPDLAERLRKAGCPEFATRIGIHLFSVLNESL